MTLRDAFYEQRFELEFRRAKGDAFQTFFERLMSLAYKADFRACRPWGNQGDRKNDGFLTSERRLFQVYAPNELTAAKATAKIKEDFEGAKSHWGNDLGSWVFVHNAVDGLPPHVHEVLLELGRANPSIGIATWGLIELREIFRKLTPADRESWLGAVPNEETGVGFHDLQAVLESLAARAVPPDVGVRSVPPGKIQANGLDQNVAVLLKTGMTKAPLVSEFLQDWHDETLGERLADAFRSEYARLRETFAPNVIFAELQAWAGGGRIGTAAHQMAVLAVIAYFFERCDIFEEPRTGQAPS